MSRLNDLYGRGSHLLKRWQTRMGEGLSIPRIKSRYHRLRWVTSIKIVRWVEKNIQDRLRRSKAYHYGRIDLRDLYVTDYDLDKEVRIPVKWDSGAMEVVRLPAETKKWRIRVFRGFGRQERAG